MAAQENHVEVVKYLMDHGANQNLTTEVRFTGDSYSDTCEDYYAFDENYRTRITSITVYYIYIFLWLGLADLYANSCWNA